MRRLSRVHLLTVGLIISLATPVFAQSDKVSLRMVPRPGVTAQMTMAQDLDMEMTVDGAAAPTPAMKMVNRTTMTVTQKAGMVKPDGSMDVVVTYGQVKVEASINGQPIPTDAALSQLANLVVTMTYNRDGEIVDMKAVPDIGGNGEAVKQMVTSLSANAPTTPMGIGEVLTTPLSLTLPLPLPSGAPMKLTGERRSKLLAVDNDAGSRVARLEVVLDGKMSGDVSPDNKTSIRFNFLLTGGGTTVMDLDKGVVRTSVTTSNLNGTIDMGGATPGPAPPMRMRATTTVTISGN